MPKIFGDKVGIAISELGEWYKYDALKKAVYRNRNKDYGIKRLVKCCPGRNTLIDFDSLPGYIQSALGDPRKVKHVVEPFYKIDGEAVAFYSTFQFEDGSRLSLEHQQKYVTNASVLKAIIELRTARINMRFTLKQGTKGIAETLCSDAASFNITLSVKHNLQHTLSDKKEVFLRTLSRFEKQGYKSLISGKHGNQNTRKVTDATLDLLKSLFAGHNQKPTATEVHRTYAEFKNGEIKVLNQDTGEIYLAADFKSLSDSTVKKYIASWKVKIGTHAIRSGDRQKYMQQFKPHHSLKKPVLAGSIISIDDRQPPFKMPNGNRVWFYNGIDLASEAFTCWVHGESKEGIILDFYRQLVRNYHDWGLNLPAELEAEMSLNSSYVKTFLREGAMFQHVRIEANNARGKRIERYFGSLRYGIEKEREGWLARPFAKKESNQAGAKEPKALSYNTIIENALTDIEKWNNQPHSSNANISRWQYFINNQNPELKPTNYTAILPFIGYKTQTSCRAGIIRLDGKEFLLGENGQVALGQKLINLMQKVEGQEIDIYWLDDNQGLVFKALVFIGDMLICEAVCKPTYSRAKVEQNSEDKANRAIMSAYVASIESYGRKQRKSIDQVIVIDERQQQFNDFVMPGLKKHTYNSEPRQVEILEQFPTVEVLNNNEPYYTEEGERSYVRPLRDRL